MSVSRTKFNLMNLIFLIAVSPWKPHLPLPPVSELLNISVRILIYGMIP